MRKQKEVLIRGCDNASGGGGIFISRNIQDIRSTPLLFPQNLIKQ